MITQIGNISIEIQRRRIKNMNIYIKPPKGDVLVTVPMRISDEEVFRFLKKKERWIIKNHEKMKNQKSFTKKEITIEQRKWLESKIIEYVLVHELCHLLEPSHNERFYHFMDRYLPDWRNRKLKLNSRV